MDRQSPRPGIYDAGLERNAANYVPLSPLSLLSRAADVFPNKLAYVHGECRRTYAEFAVRCRRLASALTELGIGPGDTVSVMAPNTPAMLECHYGIPLTGAVINPLNLRLDPASIAFILEHSEAKLLITDVEFAPVIHSALELMEHRPRVIDIDDASFGGERQRLSEIEYGDLVARGDPGFAWRLPPTNGMPSP